MAACPKLDSENVSRIDRLKLVVLVRLAYEQFVEATTRRWESDSLAARRQLAAAKDRLHQLNRQLALVAAATS